MSNLLKQLYDSEKRNSGEERQQQMIKQQIRSEVPVKVTHVIYQS